MATVGQALTAPESGWRRINADYPLISYQGTWITQTNAAYSGGINKYSNSIGDKITFSFKGTKLRIIGQYNTTSKTPASISIDGVVEQITFPVNVLTNSALTYEKINMSDTIHTVVITINAVGEYQSLQGIDIDYNGRLFHPNEVTDIKDLVVGKRIRCNYFASSGSVGSFTNMGQETADFIPVMSSTAPNGDFYFIMVESINKKKILIADRNIQHTISWDTLNTTGIVSGIELGFNNPINPLSGHEDDNVQVTDNGYISGSYGDYQGWKVFDKKNGNGDKWVRAVAANNPAELTIRFKKSKQIITALSITPPPPASAPSSEHPNHFKLQGSDNGSVWVDLFENINGIDATRKRFSFRNQNAYYYYRFVVLSARSASQMQIGEIEFENQTTSNIVNFRLPTGGTSSTDKDNEWDKYIVNSTLDGTITAGDNSVWNWGVFSWTSTTTTGTGRTRRGQNTSGGFSESLSNTSISAIGFRPVIEIKNTSQTKMLFFSNGEYKKWDAGFPAEYDAGINNSIPVMISNTAPSGVAFASTEYQPTWLAFNAFNGTTTNADDTWLSTNLTFPQWIGYDFRTGKVINKYSITIQNKTVAPNGLQRSPKNWTFEGSNDGVKWDILDSQTNITNWTYNVPSTFIIANNVAYMMYRIHITANNGATDYVAIGDIQMFEGILRTPAKPSAWLTVSTTLPDSSSFIDNGMDELTMLNRTITTFTIPMDDNLSTGEVLGNGKMFKEKINLKNYIDVKNINVK